LTRRQAVDIIVMNWVSLLVISLAIIIGAKLNF